MCFCLDGTAYSKYFRFVRDPRCPLKSAVPLLGSRLNSPFCFDGVGLPIIRRGFQQMRPAAASSFRRPSVHRVIVRSISEPSCPLLIKSRLHFSGRVIRVQFQRPGKGSGFAVLRDSNKTSFQANYQGVGASLGIRPERSCGLPTLRLQV